MGDLVGTAGSTMRSSRYSGLRTGKIVGQYWQVEGGEVPRLTDEALVGTGEVWRSDFEGDSAYD